MKLLANPYIVGNPIKTREMFFGREDDFAFVSRKIGGGKSNQIVVLCGERRSGKTSILFQIMGGRLGPSFLPVLVDMQMLAGTRGDDEFFLAILRNGFAALEHLGAAPARTDGGSSIQGRVESFLQAVVRDVPGKTVLFLIDEYELIEAKIRDGTLGSSAILVLAGILEGAYPASFVFTGSTNLEDRDPAIWRTLLGKSAYRKISYLSRRDTERLVTEPLRDAVAYPPSVVESIYRLTGGQPFYTQVVCQNLVDLLIDEGRSDPTEDDLDRVVREIVANPLPQMIYTWNSYAPGDRIMISALAGTLDGGTGWADARAIAQKVRSTRIVLPFSRERSNVLLEDAYHREVLEKNEAGAYRFRMDLFRRWIQREHSIWKVAKEANVRFRRRLLAFVIPAAAVLLAAGIAVFIVLRPPAPKAADTIPYISIFSNRGPFTVNVDGLFTSPSSAETLGDTWIMLQSLSAGVHTFVAEGPGGLRKTVPDELIDRDHTSVYIAFDPLEVPASQLGSALTQAGCSSADERSLSAALADGRAVMILTSSPAGASVRVGNEEVGTTPIAVSLNAGYTPVIVTLQGYKSQNASFEPKPGTAYLQELALPAGKAALVVKDSVGGNVYLDGRPVVAAGKARQMAVPSGPHTLRIEFGSGRPPIERKIDLLPGTVYPVDETIR